MEKAKAKAEGKAKTAKTTKAVEKAPRWTSRLGLLMMLWLINHLKGGKAKVAAYPPVPRPILRPNLTAANAAITRTALQGPWLTHQLTPTLRPPLNHLGQWGVALPCHQMLKEESGTRSVKRAASMHGPPARPMWWAFSAPSVAATPNTIRYATACASSR